MLQSYVVSLPGSSPHPHPHTPCDSESTLAIDSPPKQAPSSTADSPLSPPHSTAPDSHPADLCSTSRIADRAELIERIKAGENPTWTPNRTEDRYYPNHTPSSPSPLNKPPDHPRPTLHQGNFTVHENSCPHFPPSDVTSASPPPPPPPPPSTPLSSLLLPPSPLPSSIQPRHEDFSFATTLPRATAPVAPTHWRGFHARTPSLSSNFVFKTPTSPLVHSSQPDRNGQTYAEASAGTPSCGPIDISFADHRARRRSLPPSTLLNLQVSPGATQVLGGGGGLPLSHLHPACRSLSERWYELPSPSAARQARRLSGFGPDLPPGSFVGSYEESILNGRMSTTPSKPLSFLAQIGVLGLGKCKQSLRCPAHVVLPFPAYFYAVGDYDSPSPYVGQIDLDATLGDSSSKQSKKSPAGVGGSYRIPQRGQLQIVIKNPNKTAVKLFLVQYDLRDMEPGTKTFIRQKSYSVGDATDLPIRKDRRDQEKASLRYLIHLHIVCPSRGRYYLFKSIRVVFANRVPDGKERLRNEFLWPQPKYSLWKPESRPPTPGGPLSHRRRANSLYNLQSNETQEEAPPMPLDFSSYSIDTRVYSGNMEVDRSTEVLPEYEKMDIPSPPKNGEGHGLLAKRLKRLDVESDVTGA